LDQTFGRIPALDAQARRLSCDTGPEASKYIITL